MKKIRLLFSDRPPTTHLFRGYYVKDYFQRYFDLENYDPNKTYDPKDTLFVKRFNQHDLHDHYERAKQQGFKVLFDHVEECPNTPFYPKDRPAPGDHVIYCQKWFWYASALRYRYHDYHLYQPQRNINYRGFMPINKPRPWRGELVKKLGNRLDDFLWSFHDRHLPNDVRDDPFLKIQNYTNTEWYDSTYFSLVVESMVKDLGFITEKTFKPCAFRHPFMVVGQMHTLSLLRQWGFETYDNLWDESYDEVEDYRARFDAIIKNIDSISTGPYDPLTQEKLEHNHSRLFDVDVVHQGLKKDIVDRVMEIAES